MSFGSTLEQKGKRTSKSCSEENQAPLWKSVIERPLDFKIEI